MEVVLTGKTSWQVKDRYNKKTYSTITLKLKKDLVSEFDKKIASEGTTRTEVLRNAIKEYLKEQNEEEK